MPYTNFSFFPAPLSILALLGTGALSVALLAAAAISALAGRSALARRLGLAGTVLPAAYALLLAALGAATGPRTVPVGGEKFFCEVDCHIGYAVLNFTDVAGGDGRRAVVTLRSRFDETTISARRGNESLTPNPRSAALVDRIGRRFSAEPAGVLALAAPLRPGTSYNTDLLFRIPADAEGLRLALVESDAPVRLLLGHERAPFAGETLLALR